MGMGIGSGQGFNRMFNGSVGMQTNRMLDSLGLPDKVGDLIGAAIDSQRGDIRGMMRNLSDLNSGLTTGAMDALFGKGLPVSNFVPPPNVGSFSGLTETPMGFRPLGLSRENPFGTGLMGRAMEGAMKSNPFFKSTMESLLGGKILADGRNDGKLTVFRSPFNQIGPMLGNMFAAGLPQQGLAGILGRLNLPISGPMVATDAARAILGGFQRMEAHIAGFMKGLASPAPFENALQLALGNAGAGLPGSIFGQPMGGLIGRLQAGANPLNALINNMQQSFELTGRMMQNAASMALLMNPMLRG